MSIKYRQGDIVIIQSASPEFLQARVKDGKDSAVIAEGEVTGHAHRISKGEAKIYVDNLLRSIGLTVLSDFATLSHEEHEDIKLPRGDYEIKIQREFDWFSEEVRHVAD